jgi:hypothetical protein
MAKLPYWMGAESIIENGMLVINMRPRRWHPGYWWVVIKALYRSVIGGQP